MALVFLDVIVLLEVVMRFVLIVFRSRLSRGKLNKEFYFYLP